MLLQEQTGAAVAYWLGRRIQDRNEDFERSNHISLLSGYPEPAATQIRTRGLRPARDGYKFIINFLHFKVIIRKIQKKFS